MCRLTLCSLVALAGLVGCANGGAGAGTSSAGDRVEAHGMIIDSDSSPSDSVRLLIAALRANDSDTILKLAAIEQQTRDIQRISRGRQVAGLTDNIPQMAVAGIRLRMGFMKHESIEIDYETVEGDRATVAVSGRSPVDDRSLTESINLVRENGLWRFVGGRRD